MVGAEKRNSVGALLYAKYNVINDKVLVCFCSEEYIGSKKE
jgi:hypothetical protein